MFKKLFGRRDTRQEQVATATNEIQQFVLALRGMSDAELGNVVAMAAVVRISMRPGGGLPDEALGLGIPLTDSAEVEVRRTMVQTALAMQKQSHDMTAGAMVWVHTLRAYHFPEVRLLGRNMWGELQRGFPHALGALSFMENVSHEPPPPGTALATQFIPVGLEPTPMPIRGLGQELVDNLNRNVLASIARRAPGADWTEWRLGDQIFRISPDGKQARELQPDGTWDYKVADYVRKHARRA